MPDAPAAIIVINSGSSSLKFSLFRGETAACRGLIDRLDPTPPGKARARVQGADGKSLFDGEIAAGTHDAALEWLFQWIGKTMPDFKPAAVGHRVVHGGDAFAAPTRITPAVLEQLDALSPLAPLHQPVNLAPIRTLASRFPTLPQVACFDTAFHATHTRVERAYALPREWYDKGVKRYGFHGLSYEYVAGQLPRVDPRAGSGRTIVCHLGNGSSMCALRAGKSVATTMGFTALDGLVMGTRCGAIDPGVLLHFLGHEKMSLADLTSLLYHRSGLLGISGTSSDMRDLLKSPAAEAAEAVEAFCYRIACELGSLAAALGGLDAVVFTGGIGENAGPVRARVAELAGWMGIRLDPAANSSNQTQLHAADSPVHVLKIATNEELMIALHTLRAIAKT